MKRVETGERVLAMQQDPTYILEEDTVRRHITVGSYTYVKIAEGCDYKCSFCIIPSMRGVFFFQVKLDFGLLAPAAPRF